MATNILTDILNWSHTRPAWQRDALRRLLSSHQLDHGDIVDLTDICKSVHGLSPHRASNPLAAEQLAIPETASSPVSLASLTHHTGVNALAPEQTVSFGPNLTVVYGENGAGKSGYTRILKRACRSRFVENVLGDVLGTGAPLLAKATIAVLQDDVATSIAWDAAAAPSGALATISVFDAHCVPVYLGDRTDVAFRPFGLDLFDGLASACADVRHQLESEQQVLRAAGFVSPKGLIEGTAARKLVDTLTALTKENVVVGLATLSTVEQQRLKQLEESEKDLKAADPKQRSRELLLKATRFEAVASHVESVVETLDLAKLADLGSARARVEAARSALLMLRKATLTADVIPETGSDIWRSMWDAVATFSEAARPGVVFPPTDDGAKCPFCQQEIQPDAAARLRHFAEFVTSTAQSELREAERQYASALRAIVGIQVIRADVTSTISELAADDAAVAGKIDQCLQSAEKVRAGVQSASGANEPFQAATFEPGLAAALRTVATELRNRAAQLQSMRSSLTPQEQADLNDLRSRVCLFENIEPVKAEVERKKRLSAYAQAINDTTTNQITAKSTELTKKLITDHLRSSFQAELTGLEFTHLAVEIQAAGGAKGSLFHKLAFSNAPGVTVTDVLSEGESRALSLAAFLTELSTAPTKSGIIFDDPVSSLDHVWRERIARRLVAEARERQVIVFTHDLFFLRSLLASCAKESVPLKHQYVRRDGQAGICSPDLPWVAMSVNERIGVLRQRWQAAEKLHRTAGSLAYEPAAREIFAMLREAWERGITEILLNDVVERYRPSIETKKVAKLHDISSADCKAVEDGMTECSRWMRGHDESVADGTPLPTPAQIKTRIDELETWAKGIRGKRK